MAKKDDVVVFELPEEVHEEDMDLEIYEGAGVLDVEGAAFEYGRFVKFVRQVMQPGTDYGIIPGTPKPSMYKPGAEKMRKFFGLFSQTISSGKTEQWDTPITGTSFPLFSYDYITEIRDKFGNILATCEGNCNSYEGKYRWRWAQQIPSAFVPFEKELVCEPGTEFEFEFALENRKTTGKWGKPEEYWQSWYEDIEAGRVTRVKRKTNSGEKPGYERDGTRWRIPNDGIYDQVNTLKKMAQKRSFVGAILLATGASEFFTQDLEDYAQHLSTEETSIRMYVPEVDAAKRKLMAYIKSKGVDEAGEFIKITLSDAEMPFSLDQWDQIVTVLEEHLPE